MQKKYFFVLAALVLVYILGMGTDMMDIDASQYAEMSREMSVTGSYLQVFELGRDYLDKPPFLFWISSLSIKIFGVNNFAYKFPSFLFSLLAIFSTYKFALLYYKKELALLSALVLASCQAFFLMTNDVRTDTILMGCVIFSIWHLASWLKYSKISHLIFGCIGIAAGICTKGPIALIVPVLALGSHLILQRNVKAIFNWQHFAALVFILILLLPMCYGLYHQFDMQPNKIVNGQTAVSGLRFFFWTQSFGRITGESVWDNDANIFFLFQNLLWSFLPWVVFFVLALFTEYKQIIRQKFKIEPSAEWICVGGFTLSYLALGSSHYQLPHYIFVALPFAAVITTKYLYRLVVDNEFPKLKAILEKSHFIIFAILWIALLVLLCYSFPAALWICIFAALLFMFFLYIFLQKNINQYLLKICLSTIISLNFFMNISIYPSLLKYQIGTNIGNWIKTNNIPPARTYIYKEHIWHSLHYKIDAIIPHKDELNKMSEGDYIILPKEYLIDFEKNNIKFDIIYSVNTFSVSMLKIGFLDPNKRDNVTTPYVIIKIK
jgi:4-amino-4-deoxy-L-arabinose transferase-like glycosyltransferase